MRAHEPTEPRMGTILIANQIPQTLPTHLHKSVIVMTDYTDEYEPSAGLIVNKAFMIKRGSVLTTRELSGLPKNLNQKVYDGGEQSPGAIFSINRLGPKILDDTHELAPGLFSSIDFEHEKEKIEELILTAQIKGEHIRVMLGLTTWETGELDEQIRFRDWSICKATGKILDLIFNPRIDGDQLWRELVTRVVFKKSVFQN